MKRYSVAEREWILEELRASGLSLAAFCRREGLCYATVCGWRKRAQAGDSAAAGEGPITLVELQTEAEPAEGAGAHDGIEVILPGGIRVCFAKGSDVTDVARFCRELGR